MKLGVITDCLKTDLEKAIQTAARLNISAVQIYATTGGFSPETLTAEKKAEYKKLLSDNNVKVSALCGDMGGFGFEIEKDNPVRIEKTKRIIDLAVEFGTNIITTHIGVIPSDDKEKRYNVMLKALTECGLYAKSVGATLAIETGPETAAVLKAFIDRTKGGVGVNFDPANFIMVTGQDILEAVEILQDDIVHTHVKDGRKLSSDQTPEQVYHAFAVGGVEALNACKGFAELPIGEGDVDWDGYLTALKNIGYNGYLTIEREAGDKPLEDIKSAANFINAKLIKLGIN